MANPEHLAILRQGVEVWNRWRQEALVLKPDLNDADLEGKFLDGANLKNVELRFAHLGNSHLNGADLSGADIRFASLWGTQLNDARLRGTWFHHASVREAYFRKADLSGATLNAAKVLRADFSEAKLSKAQISMAHFIYVDFSQADLRGANLESTDFNGSNLEGANLAEAYINATSFGDVDLRFVNGLATVIHTGPSPLSINTIYLSEGNIPEAFLRGSGAPDTFITNMRALVESISPIDFYSCFISYSSRDQAFAERLYADLQSQGVRCWFAPEDLKIGDKFWHRIDESIRLYDKLMVVLSEHSVQSDWVEREVMAALEKEKQGKIVLFPITLDDAVKDCTAPWAADIRRSRHIGDFRGWKNHDDYQKALERLLRDLKASS